MKQMLTRFVPDISVHGVFSVWLRNAKVYFKSVFINCLPPLTEPLVYLVGFGYGLTPFIGEIHYKGVSMSYLTYIAPGMMVVGALFQAFFEGAYGSYIRYAHQKTWHAMLTTPLTFDEILWGEWLWATTKGIISGTLTGILAVALSAITFSQFLLVLPWVVLTSFTFAATGLISAALVKMIEHLNIPVFLFVIPMFALSGTYFPRSTLPKWLEWYVSLLPLSALSDLARLPLLHDIASLKYEILFDVSLTMVWLAGTFAIANRVFFRKIFP